MCHQVDFDPAKLYHKIITKVVSNVNFDPTHIILFSCAVLLKTHTMCDMWKRY
jgi:hypothetical protein